MNYPPVSVIICAYNAEKYIKKTIDSVRQQTYANIEILILDDASTDNTPKIIEKAAEMNGRIRYIRNSENRGIAYVRQQGLENAKYNWVSFIDADDLACSNMIEKQIEILAKEPDLIAVGTYAYYIGEDEKRVLGIQRIGPTSKEQYLYFYNNAKLLFMSNTTLYSKQHALKIGGYRIWGFQNNAGIRLQDFCEDLDLWCRLSDFGGEGKYMVTIPEPLFYYRKRVGSLSAQNIFNMQNKIRWIKDCLLRRRSKISERPYDEYIKSISPLRKLNNLRLDYAAFYYRKAGFAYIRKEYLRFIKLLFFVLILNPKYIVDKIQTQKFAKQ